MTTAATRGRDGSPPVSVLAAQLDALEEALGLSGDRFDRSDTDTARGVLQRARSRLALSGAHTVVALVGATGSGKSSLANALAGQEVTPPGVRRPTTSATQAVVFGRQSDDAGPLLDWLEIPKRHHLPDAPPELDGLVLLDLPDHDSHELANRAEVDRMVKVVDVLVWVLDPQKYADELVHRGYLAPLAGLAEVVTVVLNQIDRLPSGDVEQCVADCHRLLADDGLGDTVVIPTSARTGEGIEELRAALLERVWARRAHVDRVRADIDVVTANLLVQTVPGWTGGRVPDRDRKPARIPSVTRDRLIQACAQAAGVDEVAQAVADAHKYRSIKAVGLPWTRWWKRFRPDPLRRLHLDLPGTTVRARSGAENREAPDVPAVTSRGEVTQLNRSRVDGAMRELSEAASDSLPGPWPAAIRRVTDQAAADLPEALDAAVFSTALPSHSPWWWWVLGTAQVVLGMVTLAGLVWLGLLVVFAYFQLGLVLPETPKIRGKVPWPTAMALWGLLAGILVALLGRLFALIGAVSRRAIARRRLCTAVADVVDRRVLALVQSELDRRAEVVGALVAASR